MNRKKLLIIITIIIVGISLLLLSFAANKDSIKNAFNPVILSKYPEQLYTALYQYSNSDECFDDYFNNLENSDKLYIGGIFKSPMEEENYRTFPEIKSNLNYIFGSTLNVKAEDYYMQKEDTEPMLKYNKETEEYYFNENNLGSGFMNNLGNTSIYNLRLKDIKNKFNKKIVTYYGIYKTNDGFYYKLTNNKNIERVLEAEELMGYEETDEEYLASLVNNTENLLIFEYTFIIKNDNYNLVDFKVLDK